jgi:type VI secretion system secreted protein VgrG
VAPLEAGELTVDRFTGTEGLSRLYHFQIDFHPKDDEPLDAAELLGAEALLTMMVPGGVPRYLHGKVRALKALGLREGRWRYQLFLAPSLWWLTRVRKSRIFQQQTVPDILKAVLEEAGVDVRLSLSGSYAQREYCTQYRETDFAFLSRLMEWEGIFYYFEHSESGHTLVIGDRPSVHEPLPGGATLPLREDDGHATDGEYLSTLIRMQRLRPGKVHLKDFDFERPALDVSGKDKSPKGEAALEVYDYPGEYVTPAVGKQAARVRLEEAVQAARTLEGEGRAPSLTPGYRFEVEDGGSHAGEYTVVEVMHSGNQPEAQGGREALGALYSNQFKCMPFEVPFRPRRLTPTPSIPGIQTATVVGPAGEEIHVDEYGRVKVQFHWDREGQRDDKASCWVRVAQSWGGPAWGAQYLPRIGHEVVVRFLEGHPDRPLIGGAVYNGENPTPYALPDERTKSTLKSASSLGSNGFNELRIEDAAGEEEIFVHAQKDEDLLTEDDKDQKVLGYEELLVKKERKRTVEGNQELHVDKNDESKVKGNQTLRVKKDRDTQTARSHDETVGGNQAVTVTKNLNVTVHRMAQESVGAAKAMTIGGAYTSNIALASNEVTGGAKSVQVGAALTEVVLGSRQEMVAENKESKVKGAFQIEVKGGLSLSTGKDVKETVGAKSYLQAEQPLAMLAKTYELKADTFNLVVGDTLYLSMEKSGNVKLYAKTLTLDSSESQFKGGKVQKVAAGSVPGKSVPKQTVEDLEDAKPKENTPPKLIYRISL